MLLPPHSAEISPEFICGRTYRLTCHCPIPRTKLTGEYYCRLWIWLCHQLLQFHSSPAGIAIPIGLPVLFVIGGWMYMEGQKEEAGDEKEEVQGVEDSET
jgi:hypothetical protein